MDLADALKPREKTRCIGVDAQNFGSLIRDGHFDEPVELLIEAALHQFEQVLPSDVGPAAAPELLDLAQLIERLLEFALDRCNPFELSGLGRAFVGTDKSKFLFRELFQGSKVGLDDLVQIGGAERPIGDPGHQRVGPGLEQLLAVAGELQLSLELLMCDLRAREIAVGLGDPPISECRSRQRHGEQQARGDEELGLVAHDRPHGRNPGGQEIPSFRLW